MLKNFKENQNKFYGIAIIAFVIAANIFFSTKAPSLHEKWIRETSVGNKSVMIVNPNNHRSGGSGFHVEAPSGNTYILTNAHVCALQKNGVVDILLQGTKRYIPRRVIEVYKDHDLCLVESLQGVEGIKVAKNLSIGETVAIVGYPRLFPLTVSKGAYIGSHDISVMYIETSNQTSAYVVPNKITDLFKKTVFAVNSPFRTVIHTRESLHLTCYSRGGNSGSPVVDFYGQLIGVLYAGNPGDQFESYAVPLSFIKDFLSVY